MLVFRYVPFEAASFLAWTGIALAVVGFLSVLEPPQILGIRSRQRSAVVLVLGGALAITAVLWRASIVRVTGPHPRLDDFLPEYQFREYHETVVEASVDRVVEAARRVSFADMPAAAWLMRVRDLATLGNDAEARCLFSRYWRIIYPGSAIIRRVWLDAIVARALGPS